MPIRATTVESDPTFIRDMDRLRGTYSDIDEVLAEFCEVLKLGYELPEIGIDDQVYTRLVDYPPLGAAGVQHFTIIYHVTDPNPSWTRYRQLLWIGVGC